MAKTIGTIGVKQDLIIKQGTDFGKYNLTIKDANKLPINITGYVFKGVIKDTAISTRAVIQFSFDPIDLVNGKISMWIPNVETAKFKGNVDLVPKYVYDISMTDLSGFIEPLLFGSVAVYPNA